ncbi:MAG: MFS transporter [Aquisalimonadaceae bacterium]
MGQTSTPVTKTIVLLGIASFASAISLRIADPLLPELARTFDVSTAQAAQTITAFVLTYGLLQLVYGLLGDRYGKLRTIMAAALASGLLTVAAALSPSLGWLILLRALGGATAAGIVPLSMAWVGDTVPYEQRQATLAYLLVGMIGGFVSGHLVGGVFADTIGWRWSFIAIAVVYLGVAMALFQSQRPADGAPAHSAPRPTAFAANIVSVLRSRWARTILLIVLLEGMFTFGSLAFAPTYLHRRFDVSLSVAGATVALFGIGGLLYVSCARFLILRLGERGIALLGGVSMSLGFAALALAPSLHLAVIGSLLAGLGFYMFHNTLQTHATQMVPEARGTAVALFATCLFFGQSIGVVIGALIVAGWSGTPLFALASAGLIGVGLVFTQLLGRKQPMTSSAP